MFFTLILIVKYLIAGRTGNGYPVQNYYDYDYRDSVVHTKNNEDNFEIGDGNIYAGFVKKSYGMSGVIKFNTCKKVDTNKKYNCFYPGGEVTLFGGKYEKPYVNVVPTKVDVTEAVQKAGISKIDNVRFEVTSIEDLDGKKHQKEVFHPLRIFSPKGIKDDFYTIFLDETFIQPPKIRITKNIKLKVKSRYDIFFIANNENDYKNCNAEKFSCMPSDIYIDPKVYGIYKINHSNMDCYIWIGLQFHTWTTNEQLNFTGLPQISKWNERGNGNGNSNVYVGNGNENNHGNINGNNNIGNNNVNNNPRRYYIFDPDGLPKNCSGLEPSRGSVVQIIIE